MSAVPVASDPAGLHGALSSVLVGREHELEAIARLLRGSDQALVEIEGEAGIGKSTLWQAGVHLTRDAGALVLTARPAEVESPVAYGALASVLGPILPDVADALPTPRRGALEGALRLRQMPASRLDETAVALGTLSALREAARQQRIVVAIDDVQWLDAGSRVVLAYALRNLADDERVSVLTTARTGVTDGGLGLSGSRLGQSRLHLELRALSLGAVHRIVHDRLGLPLSRPRLVRLHSVSGGNPFHAIELARAVARAELDGSGIEVPDSLAGVLRARLAPLSRSARRLLVAVAAAGDVHPDMLARLGTDAAVDEVIDDGILLLDHGRVRFSHPLLGSTVMADAGELLRRRVHQQLATVAESAEERARHLALAGCEPDEGVAAALEQAAVSACARGARAAGASFHEQAASLTPADDVESRDRRRLAAAGAAFQSGEPETARATLETIAAGGTPRRFEAQCMLGTLLDETVGGTASLAAFEAALAAPDAGTRSDAHRGMAQALAYVGSLEAAQVHADAAVDEATRHGDDLRLAYALAMQALIRRFSGHPGWAPPLDRSLALEVGIELPTLDGCPSAVAADLRRVGLELDAARTAYETILVRASDRGDVPTEAWCQYGLAVTEIGAGRLDVAREHAAHLADLAAQTGLLRLPSLRVSAQLASLAGELDRARGYLATVVDEARSRDEHHNLRAALQLEGLVELSVGNAAAAVPVLREARELAKQTCVGEPGLLVFLVDEVEALATTGDTASAELVLDSFVTRAATSDAPWIAPLTFRARGLIDAARGLAPEAIEALERAVAAEDDVPMVLERARTRLALGRVLRRVQQRARARAELEEALARFGELRAPLWAERARNELARVGGRAASSDDLTPTEQRIASLAAEGQSNREIGAALFVTPKTVESALTRVYRKLGVRSRVELSRRLATEHA
jgi:DNA-binding CsgD family transcriptional regulator